MKIILWTAQGNSLIFEDVKDFKQTDLGITFDKLNEDTKAMRHCYFYNSSMIGYEIE